MKAKDFKVIDKEEFLHSAEDLIESGGQCSVIDHCINCPFNQDNNIDDLPCSSTGYISDLDPFECDILVLINATKFRKMLLRRRRNGIIG